MLTTSVSQIPRSAISRISKIQMAPQEAQTWASGAPQSLCSGGLQRLVVMILGHGQASGTLKTSAQTAQNSATFMISSQINYP